MFWKRKKIPQDEITHPVKPPVDDLSVPTKGMLYAFATSPYTEFSPLNTGRYAAFKVLDVNNSIVVIAIMSGIWSTIPTLSEASKSLILHENYLAHKGRPAIFGTLKEWWKPSELNEMTAIGIANISCDEMEQAAKIIGHAIGSRTSTLHAVNYGAEGQWRWENDRENFEAEIERSNTRNDEKRKAKEERYRTRLSKLTWSKLLEETPFERWVTSPPFPPKEFTNAARMKVHETCLQLEKLGGKPRKADVRKILKSLVQWFNQADEKAGGVIETEEREDICLVLEEFAFVAKQKSLVEEIDNWREW